ncbi:uncharacterized protein Fot_21960 [Forsythia ovata]|uniref:GTPase HflX N-terminal domain-containing protein n=1 Tax=Forsythia ovata TaxID=205694 RepID=A0ABD1UWC8_9LAMI
MELEFCTPDDTDEERNAAFAVHELANIRTIHELEEKAYLVGVARNSDADDSFGIEKSLSELSQLADTAGLLFVGSTYQKFAMPNPRTKIGSGKVAEIKSAIHEFDVETSLEEREEAITQAAEMADVYP